MKNSCIVDNEDMEELKKVIEKKSIQKKYLCMYQYLFSWSLNF